MIHSPSFDYRDHLFGIALNRVSLSPPSPLQGQLEAQGDAYFQEQTKMDCPTSERSSERRVFQTRIMKGGKGGVLSYMKIGDCLYSIPWADNLPIHSFIRSFIDLISKY